MKLTFYLLRKFIVSLFQVTFFVMALVFLVDLIDQFARFSSKDVAPSLVFFYCVLNLVENFLQFLPLIVLLAALFCFMSLARHSEVVVMRAAGVPATKFVFTPILATLTLGLLIISLLNPLVVSSRIMTQKYENQFLGREQGLVSAQNGNGIWLRSELQNEVRLIRFSNVNWQNNVLRGVTIYRFFGGDTDTQSEQISASRGVIENNEWVLDRATVSDFGESIETKFYMKFSLPTDKNFASLFDDFYTPKTVRNSELPSYIEGLRDDGYDTKDAESYLLNQLNYPLFLMTLALIGSVFALAPERFGGATRRLFYALGFGFLVFGTTQLATSVGVAGYIPIWLAAFGVSLAAFFVAFAFLLFQEDG